MRQNKPKHAPTKQAATNPGLALALVNNKPKPKKQNKPKTRSAQRTLPARLQHNAVHECALMYASAIFDPENTSEGACVPYGFPTPSMKQKVFTRGTFALGTTGQGFIVYSPNTCNDVPSVICSTSASVGTAATALNSFTNLQNTNLSKLMFSSADVVTNKTVASRLVSGGIKIRYSGTEANRNGTMTALEEPNHGNLLLSTGNNIRSFINSFVERPDPLGSFMSTNLSGPISSNETQFQNVAAPYGNPVAIFIDGLAGDKYEFECYQHVEYIGQNVPGVSASHSDPIAYAKLVETAKAITLSEPLSDNNAKSGFSKFLMDMGTTIKDVIKTHGPDVIGMISNYLLPGSGFVTKPFSKAVLQRDNRRAITNG